jgi:hypothetical protein
MMKDNIDEVLAIEYENYNGKPFNVDPMFNFEYENVRLTKNYIIKILNLNQYLMERTNSQITDDGFSNFLFDWFRESSGKKFSTFDFYLIKVELLFFSGIYAFYEIMWKEDGAYGKDLIRKYEKKKQIEEAQIKKIEKILDGFETKLALLITKDKGDELFNLQKEYYKIIINNNGNSIIVFLMGRRVVQEINERIEIPVTKICELIADIFEMFSLIPKKAKINFGGNFNRQLNRIDKQKEETLIKVTKQIIKLHSF